MGPVTSDLNVFLGPGMGRKVLGSHPGHVQVGDGHGTAAQGTLYDDYSTWSTSQFASTVSQRHLCVDPGALSCWLVTLG